jgi:hypothetical protein
MFIRQEIEQKSVGREDLRNPPIVRKVRAAKIGKIAIEWPIADSIMGTVVVAVDLEYDDLSRRTARARRASL